MGTRLTGLRRLPFDCGHRGLGARCNRCKEAVRLQERAERLLLDVELPDGATKEQAAEFAQHLMDKATHLLGPQVTRSERRQAKRAAD